MSRPSGTDGPRVLAFADGAESLVAACRVHAPLAELRRQGLIAGYVVTDHTLHGLPRSGRFDVVWLQRAVDPTLAHILAERLEGRFLLDVDDHLLCRPAYIEPRSFPRDRGVRRALAACRVLTVPTRRLASLLAARSGEDLAGKALTCPNAVDFPEAPLRVPARPSGIVLTQGHRLALTVSRNEVLGAVVDCARHHGLPVHYYGSPLSPSEDAVGFARIARPAGVLSYADYHEVLAASPALMGVAPLETVGDPDTVEFVSGKSDIKMVELGGYGHPSVYSRALPYVESDLSCGRLAENTYESWSAALRDVLEGSWAQLADEQRRVREKRSLQRVARERWWPAMQAATLERPVDVASMIGRSHRARSRLDAASARVRWHLRRH